MPNKPRGVCRLESIEGKGPQRTHTYTMSCGCCHRTAVWIAPGASEGEKVYGVQWARDAAIALGWIYTATWGWVSPHKRCQAPVVLLEWRRSKGRSWAWRVRKGTEGVAV